MNRSDLSKFNNSWYKPGAGALRRFVWYCINAVWINSAFPISGFKIFLLRFFGAKIGKNVFIKPHVNIKYPWKLVVGDNVWIGEYSWIDNLGNVTIGNNVCLSQGAFILCGNHNYKSLSFDLMVGDITLEDGVWIGAKAVVCPGITCRSHSVLSVSSVATSDLEAYSIYQGNPAKKIRERVIA
jgi:putative colanic acid biosynthesis acetyltransferase WcaF